MYDPFCTYNRKAAEWARARMAVIMNFRRLSKCIDDHSNISVVIVISRYLLERGNQGIASKASKGLMMSEAMHREMKIVLQYIIDKVYIASSL